MHRAYILILLLATATPVAGQVLTGRITDAETGEALAGATVYLPALQLGTAADAEGQYRLTPPRSGSYRLVISYVGYQNETRAVTLQEGVTTPLDVALRHTTLEAPAITITAKATASDVLSTPQAVTVLDEAELLRNRGTTAFDALDETAGVRLLKTGPGIAKPVVRGLTAQRVLVIQDGIRQEGQQWGDEHAPEIDAFDVERIEVVRGPASLLYGSDALGGVVQASSGDLFEHQARLGGSASVQAMTNPRQGATHLTLGGRTGATVYEAAGTLRRAGSYATPDALVPNTGIEEQNAALRLGREFSWGRMQAGYQHVGSELGLFEPEVLEEDPADDRFAIEQPYQRVRHDRARLHLQMPLGRGDRLEWTSTVQQNRRREFEAHEEGEEEGLAKRRAGGGGGEEPALFLRLTTVTSDARFHHRPLGRFFGTVGVSGFYQKNETLAEEVLIPGARTLNGSLYLFEEYVENRITVSGGLRLDARRLEVDANDDLGVEAQTRSYTAVTGALGAAWQPREGVSLAVNAGRAWRAPVLIELFGNGVHEGTIRFERGDAGLVPEASTTLESTLRWLSPHLFVEATGYVNRIDDFIFPRLTDAVDPESGFFIYRYEQAQARLWGGELRVDLHPHAVEWLRLHVAADLTRARNLDTDAPLPFTPAPRVVLTAEAEWERLGGLHGLRLHAGPTLVARQDRVDPTEAPSDGYTLWDASLSGTLRAGGLALTPVLAVENLLDAEYTSHLSRFKPFGVLNPGRSVRLEVRVRF